MTEFRKVNRRVILVGDLSTSLFGYNKGQVDSIVSQQTGKIQELEKKVNELESQLSTYIELESVLKEGILDARVKGNEIINESSHKAELLMNQTNEQVAQYKEDFVHQGNDLLTSGMALKNRLDFMKDEMRDMIDQVAQFIDGTDFEKIYPKTDVEHFAMKINEFSDGKISASTQAEGEKTITDSTLTEDEKRELEKLIHEVIANDAATKENTVAEKPFEKKLIELKSING